MALTTEHKLYIGLGLLAALGAGYYFQSREQVKEAKILRAEAQREALPKLEITEEEAKKVDKIEITSPADPEAKDEDKKKSSKVVLVKKKKGDEDEWDLTEPVKALANQNNVKTIIDGLPKLKIKESIAAGTDQYDKYEVNDEKAIHAVLYQGDKKLADLYFGKSGGRGQMVRVADKDGVFKLEGFSSWNYKRTVKNWRDTNVFKFDEDKVKTVEITNENGVFSFAKDGDEWQGKHQAKKGGPTKGIKDFKSSKVDDMVRAYKNLNATDFGDDKTLADVGLDEPVATVTITLNDGARRVVKVGDNREGDTRWALREGSDQIYVLSGWSANWAVAAEEKFQDKKPEDEDKDKDKDKTEKKAKPKKAAAAPKPAGS